MGALAFLLATACTDPPTTETRTYDSRSSATVLDVVRPGGAVAAPAIVYIHGGAWRAGSRRSDAGTVERFARAGYVGVNVDYRLVPDGVFPNAVDDAFCALAYVQANAVELGIDPARIVVMGHSAGGHLTGMLATAADVAELQDDGCPSGRAQAPAAAVSVAGPMDLPALGKGGVVEEFVGVAYDRDPARWALASPRAQVSPGEPAMLFIHAEHDLVVPVAQSEQMVAAVRAAGGAASLLRLEGGGHVLGDGAGLGQEQLELSTDTAEAWMAMFDFLDRTVGAP